MARQNSHSWNTELPYKNSWLPWDHHAGVATCKPSWVLVELFFSRPSSSNRYLSEDTILLVDPPATPALGYWVTPSPEGYLSQSPKQDEQRRTIPTVLFPNPWHTEFMSIIKWLLFQVPVFWGWFVTQWETTGTEWKPPNSPLYKVGDLSM